MLDSFYNKKIFGKLAFNVVSTNISVSFLPPIQLTPHKAFGLGSLSLSRKPFGTVGESLTLGEEQMLTEVLWTSLEFCFFCVLSELLPRKMGNTPSVPKESPLGHGLNK